VPLILIGSLSLCVVSGSVCARDVCGVCVCMCVCVFVCVC